MPSPDPVPTNVWDRTRRDKKDIGKPRFVCSTTPYMLPTDFAKYEKEELAQISNVLDLEHLFSTSTDIHTSRAMELFDVSEEEVTREMRMIAKNDNFLTLYGGSSKLDIWKPSKDSNESRSEYKSRVLSQLGLKDDTSKKDS